MCLTAHYLRRIQVFSASIISLSLVVVDLDTLFIVARLKITYAQFREPLLHQLPKPTFYNISSLLRMPLAFNLNNPNYHYKLLSHKQPLIAGWNRKHVQLSRGGKVAEDGAGEPDYS